MSKNMMYFPVALEIPMFFDTPEDLFVPLWITFILLSFLYNLFNSFNVVSVEQSSMHTISIFLYVWEFIVV